MSAGHRACAFVGMGRADVTQKIAWAIFMIHGCPQGMAVIYLFTVR
jgi:hypothetical protein